MIACHPAEWKHRPAYRITNGTLELTVLLGGGHIAGARRIDCPVNVLWEAPWPMIDPQDFREAEHARLYGGGAAGKFLSGYTGHALAMEYFGMPSPAEGAAGLPLHGEASSRQWQVQGISEGAGTAELTLACDLPAYGLRFVRAIRLKEGSAIAHIHETVHNQRAFDVDIQWVQHVTFGGPFAAPGQSTLSLSASRGITWPLAYEGKCALVDDCEFVWPFAPAIAGGNLDLSRPFAADHVGFVAALQVDPTTESSFVTVVSRAHSLVAGYVFERTRFPWIALWQENRAREYAPWNGNTRALGVEFGTSPLPMGLEQAKQAGPLFGTPTLARIPANGQLATEYDLFIESAPSEMTGTVAVERHDAMLVLRDGDTFVKVI